MGHYFIIEGPDGAGKSTAMGLVADMLTAAGYDVLQTYHPGSTPLGKHLRQLVKYPKTIDPNISMDALSRQVLYMVDTINFINQVLIPSLSNNKIVLADRSSFIAALIYGLAEGLKVSDIQSLFHLTSSPRPDKLYILKTDVGICAERLVHRSDEIPAKDHYDNKPVEFKNKIMDYYNNFGLGVISRDVLASVMPLDPDKNIPFVTDNFVVLEPTRSAEAMAKTIFDDMLLIMEGTCNQM